MNLILKIIQGPNAGAEIALIEGVNVKLGRGEQCDIVLADQTLADVACEIEVGAERVTLLLPGGATERLEPLHVKVFETTAIAVGPADSPWGTLIWPSPEEKKEEEAEESQEEKPAEPEKPKTRWRALRWTLLVVLLLVVRLECVVWFFWPTVNKYSEEGRAWTKAKYEEITADKVELAAQPVRKQTIEELAMSYGTEIVRLQEGMDETVLLKGNLKTRAERMKLIAEAYEIQPGVKLELSDDESLKNSAEELLHLVSEGALKVVEGTNRRVVGAGQVATKDELRRALEALKADVPHIDSIDCTNVRIVPPEPVKPAVKPVSETAVVKVPPALELDDSKKTPEPPPKPPVPKPPISGVMTTPFPCLVLKNGRRVPEGAEFNGFVVSKITDDVVVLKYGDDVIEWRP